MMKKQLLAICIGAVLSTPALAQQQGDSEVTATQLQEVMQQMQRLQKRVEELEAQLAAKQEQDVEVTEEIALERSPRAEEVAPRKRINANTALQARVERLEEDIQAAENAPITIGGAVRTQFVWEDYNEGNKDRGGDIDFDLLRLDYSGTIGDVILSAQYRWFQYMESVQHAWVGYNFNDNWQGQVGITKVPFGNTPYNSNNYFFSSNFYVGLEDDHDAGIKLRYRDSEWDFDIAFFKNDEQGGVDGYVSNREDRYAYDPLGVRLSGEGIYDTPDLAVGESNSFAARVARKYALSDGRSFEWGLSGQMGKMNDGSDDVGDRSAFAVHGVYNVNRWTFMGQVSQYDYDMDMANEGIVVGAYAFYDTIPSKATLYTANIAYSLPVKIGPISNLTFYNDYSLMTDKRGGGEDTVMNVLGMAVSAGGLYTYFDLVTAKNQPFVGGSMAGNATDTNTRFNINIGYYF
ncbi:carbohydrate porin [Pseudidiomarina sp. 1ASP75-14]|uniref:carbohydrate porin n=1 Tax=Pseudidiomarina terrestris TaxID=2820060 RepID=UPI00264BD947|nr:carbohydrate porin [Pseudidiomarina sp. 1ASP75-14]MDN7138802.1 carbohydrate porin [Pseudidiomarina sp. 1ASP75-14]